MSSIRLEKISELIKEEVSLIIKKEVNDPRIGFVSITDVVVSPDIKYVKIYISCLGNAKEKSESIRGLESATSFIRGKLGHKLILRFTPEIMFIQDKSLERGSRVIALMNDLQKGRGPENVKKTVRKNTKRA